MMMRLRVRPLNIGSSGVCCAEDVAPVRPVVTGVDADVTGGLSDRPRACIVPENRKKGRPMGVTTVQQMADRVAGLMEDRLRIGGTGLREKLKRGGRRLPRKIRREAEYLADVCELAQHPKVQMMLDDARVAEAYDKCVKYLNPLGASERMKGALIGVGGSIAFALLVVAAATIGVMVWRGLI